MITTNHFCWCSNSWQEDDSELIHCTNTTWSSTSLTDLYLYFIISCIASKDSLQNPHPSSNLASNFIYTSLKHSSYFYISFFVNNVYILMTYIPVSYKKHTFYQLKLKTATKYQRQRQHFPRLCFLC